ncbi:MAG: DUF4278 domain-containing protein [Prochloraceae cyanobacterium]
MAKLCYRGISYEKTIPTLELQESEIKGKYRGVPCYSRSVKINRNSRFKFPLKYRGSTYGLKQ